MTKNKKLMVILGAVLLVCAAAVMLIVWQNTREEPEKGGKEIVLKVISVRDNYDTTKTYHTEKEYFGDFLVEENLIGYSESAYGRFITSVQGMESDDAEQYWWCVYENGESAVEGIDSLVINDGDEFMLELKQGW